MNQLEERARAAMRYVDRITRDGGSWTKLADALLVAADALEESGDMPKAVLLRKEAEEARQVEAFIWTADTEMLEERWPCGCCCHEHTFPSCPARLWWGCRGSGSSDDDYYGWMEHYSKFHGMTKKEFEGT